MSYETKVSRDHYGLEALTVIDLGINGRRVLRVTTSKCNRGVSCTATAVLLSPDTGNGVTGFQWVPTQDYTARLVNDPTARATETTIRRIHAAGLAAIEPHLAAARAQYAPKPEPAASTHADLTLTGSNRAADANPNQAGLL